MPEEREILIKVSATEKRFIEFCRQIKFAQGQIEILDGLPKKILMPVKSVRFDVSTNYPLTTGLEKEKMK